MSEEITRFDVEVLNLTRIPTFTNSLTSILLERNFIFGIVKYYCCLVQRVTVFVTTKIQRAECSYSRSDQRGVVDLVLDRFSTGRKL